MGGDSGELVAHTRAEGRLLGPCLARGGEAGPLFHPEVSWLGEAPRFREDLCLAQSHGREWQSLTQKQPHRNTQKNVGPKTWAPRGPGKSTREINHRRWGRSPGSWNLLGRLPCPWSLTPALLDGQPLRGTRDVRAGAGPCCVLAVIKAWAGTQEVSVPPSLARQPTAGLFCSALHQSRKLRASVWKGLCQDGARSNNKEVAGAGGREPGSRVSPAPSDGLSAGRRWRLRP